MSTTADTARRAARKTTAPVKAAKAAKTAEGTGAIRAKKAPAKQAPTRKSAAPRAVQAVLAPAAQGKKRDKVVRDGFSIPKGEYTVLQALKERAAALGCGATKKSEVLRAGIQSLAAMTDSAFLAAMRAVASVKTGRPGKPAGKG